MTLKNNPCKVCNSPFHTGWVHKERKPLKAKKPMKKFGKQTTRYNEFRDKVARPYLIATFGNKCAHCERADLSLDVDHIKKRGSHPELKYDLNNLQLMCRRCHDIKDNQYGG